MCAELKGLIGVAPLFYGVPQASNSFSHLLSSFRLGALWLVHFGDPNKAKFLIDFLMNNSGASL